MKVKPVKCIIVDDEKEARDRLESLLAKFEVIEIIAKEGSPEIAIKTIVELLPELVFIDVEMPRKNGFDVIKEVRKNNVNPTFIFVTGFNQYAIKAIRNAAFDFLLKPIDIDELKEALERFCKKRQHKPVEEIPLAFIKKFSVTPREIDVITLLAQNKNSRQIAEILFISKFTVETHRKNILEKTNVNSTQKLLSLLFDYQ